MVPCEDRERGSVSRAGALTGSLRMLVFTALAVALGVALYGSPRVREPYYYLLYARSADDEERAACFRSLLATRPAAWRADLYVSERARVLVAARAWEEIVDLAARGYGGAAAGVLVPLLEEDDEEIRGQVTAALCRLGPAATAAVLRLVHHPDWTVRYAAVCILRAQPSASPAALAALREAAEDEHPDVRALARRE